jgi:large subunit ribosomal protein L21
MYAIVKTGGKQYRVERGQRLLVERLAAEAGSNVTLEPILYRSDEAVFDKTGLESVQVTAKVVAHVRGEKLRVFKFKPKRGYKRRTGHRQDLTQIEVTDIAHGKAKAKAAKPAAAAPVADEQAAKAPAAKAGEKPAAKPKAKASAAKPQAGKGSTAKPSPAKPPSAKPSTAKASSEKPSAGKPAKPKAKARSAKPKEEPSDGA